jgi:hypothetical protein
VVVVVVVGVNRVVWWLFGFVGEKMKEGDILGDEVGFLIPSNHEGMYTTQVDSCRYMVWWC